MKHLNEWELESELVFTALRSRGPGGQNVNKVSSAAMAFWDFESSSLLNFEEKYLVRSKLPSHINKEGKIYVRSDEFRDLPQNKSRCVEKIISLLAKAFHKEKVRKPTKATRASRVRKLETKNKRAEVKSFRKKIRKSDYE